MAEYSIEIGITGNYRYIGIKPPVDQKLKEKIFEELGQEIVEEALTNGYALSTAKPAKGPEYSELGLSGYLHDTGKTSAQEIASRISNVLTAAGHTVAFDPEFRPVGHGRYLFGGEAERLG